jgi:hypothetical protein
VERLVPGAVEAGVVEFVEQHWQPDEAVLAGELEGEAFESLRLLAIQGMFSRPAGWTLFGYPGPKAVWSEEEQRIR